MDTRLLLGNKSVLGREDVDFDSLLLYAFVITIDVLGKVYVLEKGQDFIVYKPYPDCEKDTSLYKHYLYACEHEDAQMIEWDLFRDEHYLRHKDTGLNHMYNLYNSFDMEITEYVPPQNDCLPDY